MQKSEDTGANTGNFSRMLLCVVLLNMGSASLFVGPQFYFVKSVV